MPETPQIVWLKRDLRVDDHAPLAEAAATGPVLALYVVEPEYWTLPDTSKRQWLFIRGALEDLRERLAAIGGTLTVRSGDMVETLAALRESLGPFGLWAHEETGNAWTYARDERVRAWCRETGTRFEERRQFGILRGRNAKRVRWASQWDAFMAEPVVPIPQGIRWLDADSEALPDAKGLGLADCGIEAMQEPGRERADETLRSFLHDRGEHYRTDMSSPVEGEAGCSRMSTHLSTGTISMRVTYQRTVARQAELKDDPDAKAWRASLRSYVGRLHWHCHFMQKLEAEPEIEWLPMARAYEGLRETDPVRLKAFRDGETGYPFVDACIAYLRATGWINFRMRAMLQSFASYHLWLRWQDSGMGQARLYTDYEPGIHWPQSQMQSGETGINAVRIYSPVKQGFDQDASGDFTRRWVPALAGVEGKAVHEPWKLDRRLNYPERIVDHTEAVKLAKSRIWSVRGTEAAKAEAKAVFDRHGSRAGPRSRVEQRAKAKARERAAAQAAE